MNEGLIMIILGGILVLGLWLWFSVSMANIAEMKGYDREKYIYWVFFFGILGVLMVVALPDKKLREALGNSNKKISNEFDSDELPAL